MPDHASLELAFLACLSGPGTGALAGLEAAFLRQHAGRWLPALGRRMAGSKDPVYAPIGALLCGWLEEAAGPRRKQKPAVDRKALARRSRSRLPILSEPEACTLCSFCVQACPAGALSIEEDDRSTDLFLASERCSGCGKCARVCPEPALAMGDGRADLPQAGRKIRLRHSQRAACQACGASMISQAELAYVARRLDHPSWLDYCPDCRERGGTIA